MNWSHGIEQLLSSGRSVREISTATGLSVSAVYDIKNGYSKEPRGMAAVLLHKMIKKVDRQVGASNT